jgi:hypothetical protein
MIALGSAIVEFSLRQILDINMKFFREPLINFNEVEGALCVKKTNTVQGGSS